MGGVLAETATVTYQCGAPAQQQLRYLRPQATIFKSLTSRLVSLLLKPLNSTPSNLLLSKAMEDTYVLQSQTLLWWSRSDDEYVRSMIAVNHVAAQEGIIVEFEHVEATVAEPDQFARLLPIYYGVLIRVLSRSVIPQETPGFEGHDFSEDLSEDDVLSRFQTRRCDDTVEDGQDQEVCCVCLDDLYRGSVTTLNCRHEFHADCIRRWLVHGQNFCPLCKARAIS